MLEFIDINIINIALGLISLMVANILLGTGLSIIDNTQEFDIKKLKKGILKSLLVIVSFSLVYVCGLLNPNVVSIDINGQTVNLISGINIMLTLSAGLYAKKVFDKLGEVINLNVTNDEGEGI